MEKPFKTPLRAQEGAEGGDGIVHFSGCFCEQEDLGRVWIGGRQGLDDGDEFAVIGEEGGQIGLIPQQAVFFAMMEPIELSEDQALKLPTNIRE